MTTKSDIVMYLIKERDLYKQLRDKHECKLIEYTHNEVLIRNLKENINLYEKYIMSIRKTIHIFENLNPDLILTNNDVNLNRDEVVMYLINEHEKYKRHNKWLETTIQILMACNAEFLNKEFDKDYEDLQNYNDFED